MQDENQLISEHVICYENSLNANDIEYICRKSNALGLVGRDIHKVYTVHDGFSKHLYFDADPIRKKNKQ